ncbi:MAG: DUF4157 domain-containing protein, partial [Opitutus sp.]
MESRFGHDFSAVRIHSGPEAAASADAVEARAYTVGPHIVFGEGEDALDEPAGERLLAHEMAHVVQQTRGGSAEPVFGESCTLEHEAGAAESAFMSGPGAIDVLGASAPHVARQPLSTDPFNTEEEPRSLRGSVNVAVMSNTELDREQETIANWVKHHPHDPRIAELKAEQDSIGLFQHQKNAQDEAARFKEGLKKYGRLRNDTGHGYEEGDESFMRWMMKPNHQLGFDEPGFTREEVGKIAREYDKRITKATEPSPEKRAYYDSLPFEPPEQTYAEQLEDGRYYSGPVSAMFEERNRA